MQLTDGMLKIQPGVAAEHQSLVASCTGTGCVRSGTRRGAELLGREQTQPQILPDPEDDPKASAPVHSTSFQCCLSSLV